MTPDHEAAKKWAGSLGPENTFGVCGPDMLNLARAYLDLVPREQRAEAAERERDALKQRVAELERERDAARKEANVAAKKVVAALDKRWPNLNIEGWDNEEAAGIVAAALAAYRAKLDTLSKELEAAREVASGLHDFATAHEKWEAALIMDDAAWQGGMAALPTLTETLYAGMMELQRQRAAALVTYDLAAYRATQTKEPRDEKAE